MKKEKNKNLNQGFTLIELLVVVLIIGILAAIALPQYRMAVTKAKVAAILPIMRRTKDAVMEWKLVHGHYCKEVGECYEDGNCWCTDYPAPSDLGVEWPTDFQWEKYDIWYGTNNYWSCGSIDRNGDIIGFVFCDTDKFSIIMYQPDDPFNANYRGMTTCETYTTEGHRICKALGGKEINSHVYQL